MHFVELPEFPSEEWTTVLSGISIETGIKLELDISAAQMRDGFMITFGPLEKAETPTWQVRLQWASPSSEARPSVFAQSGSSEPQLLATFRYATNELQFAWSVNAPKDDACQVANGLLTLTSGGKRHRCVLRKAITSPLVEIDLSDSPQRIPLTLAPFPRTDRLSLRVAPRQGFAESVTIDPPEGVVPVKKRLRLLPQATWQAEFHFELVRLTDELIIFHRPYFFLGGSQRQDFTFERLNEAIVATTQKIQRDSQRLEALKDRIPEIPGDMASARSASMPAAQRNTILARLLSEHKSAQGGVARLTRTLPITKQAAEALQNYRQLANSLHRQSQVEVSVVAMADTGEIPLWIAK